MAALRMCRRRCHLSAESEKSTWTSSPLRHLALPSVTDPAVLSKSCQGIPADGHGGTSCCQVRSQNGFHKNINLSHLKRDIIQMFGVERAGRLYPRKDADASCVHTDLAAECVYEKQWFFRRLKFSPLLLTPSFTSMS